MRRIAFHFLVACSLIGIAAAATRPHYGGILRVQLQSAPGTLDIPANAPTADYWDATRVLALVADNLIAMDAQGRALPALAISWQNDSNARHWQFTLRRGVKFQDGSVLSAAAVAQILTPLHPDWHLQSSGDALTIDADTPLPSLLAELALPRNAILKRNAAGLPLGTGAFRIAEFQPGKLLKLAANEECWSGRPYLDAIEIEFGRSLRDQAIALELGRTDVIEVSPAASNSASARVRTSLPVELMALVFPANSKALDSRVREALSLSIDRRPIQSVLLKGAGDPAGSLLPNWMTGYSAAFPAQANVQSSKALLADSRQPAFILSYDPRDPQAQLIAERIALNAREVGITLQVSLSGADDLRLVRVVLPSPDPATSLREAARQLGLPQAAVRSNTVEDLYQAERTLLDGHAVIPLFHLPFAGAASVRVRDWDPDRRGEWNLPQVWLEAGSR
jgi:peptide/nickel transport system substrate-binding protein